jgi:peptide/nickel transport system permease protein
VLPYIVRRLAAGLLVLLGVSLVTFILLHVVPGDPVAAMFAKRADPATLARIRHELGLDRPLPIQYADFLARAVTGDLGQSFRTREPVMAMIARALPVTATLALAATVVMIALGLPVGIGAALRPHTWLDYLGALTTLAFISAPVFWVAVVAQLCFGLLWDLLPISGWDSPAHIVLPALVLGSRYAAAVARYTRAAMLDVLGHDYVRTARAKGLGPRSTVLKHALKSALVPVLTVLGLEMGGLLTGSILTESVFGIPGLGRLTVQGLEWRDFPLVQGTVLCTATIFVLINLAVDLGYALVDPRIRLAGRGD